MKKSTLYIILFLLALSPFAYSGQIKNGGGATIGGAVTDGTSDSILFIDGSGNLGQDNTNLNWNDATNNLRIGPGPQTSPGTAVNIQGNGVATFAQLALEEASGGLPRLMGTTNGGTLAIPAGSSSGTDALEIVARGVDASGNYENAAELDLSIDGDPSTTAVPGSFKFYTSQAVSAGLIERLRITSVGASGLAALNASTSVGIAGQLETQSNIFLASGSKITTYNGTSTVSNGVPAEYATVDLTTPQTAAIAATTAYAVPSAGAGMYRISYVAKVTTAAGTSSVLGGTNGFQVRYTDADDSIVTTTAASVTTNLNSTQAQINGSIIVNAKASTNIQYIMGYTSVPGVGSDMAYTLHLKIEAL